MVFSVPSTICSCYLGWWNALFNAVYFTFKRQDKTVPLTMSTIVYPMSAVSLFVLVPLVSFRQLTHLGQLVYITNLIVSPIVLWCNLLFKLGRDADEMDQIRNTFPTEKSGLLLTFAYTIAIAVSETKCSGYSFFVPSGSYIGETIYARLLTYTAGWIVILFFDVIVIALFWNLKRIGIERLTTVQSFLYMDT